MATFLLRLNRLESIAGRSAGPSGPLLSDASFIGWLQRRRQRDFVRACDADQNLHRAYHRPTPLTALLRLPSNRSSLEYFKNGALQISPQIWA
jgi:hypothetical protein